jgi:hypothetical protein
MAKDHRIETFQPAFVETIRLDGELAINGIAFKELDGRFLSDPVDAADIDMFNMARDCRLVNVEPPYDHVSDLGNETRNVAVDPSVELEPEGLTNTQTATVQLISTLENADNPPGSQEGDLGNEPSDDDKLEPSEQEAKAAALETIKTFGFEVLPGKSTAIKIALAAVLEGKASFTSETLGAMKTESLIGYAQTLQLVIDGLDRNGIIAAVLEKTSAASGT